MRIGFVGGGKLADALVAGIIRGRVCKPEEVIISDIDASRRELMGSKHSVRVTASNDEVIAASDTIILALKPNVILSATRELGGLPAAKLFITVAAGVPSSRVESVLPEGTRLVRAMPNINCAVGESCTALCRGSHATEGDLKRAERVFASVGLTFRVDEAKMDAVTALSGSGPAYAFVFIEALADGGVYHGLPREDAVRMAAQTLAGAGRMVLETGLHPAELKDRVASPGGTTIAGLRALEDGAFRASVIDAVAEAHRRSKELSV